MKKIFVVEDDGSICDELVQILENEGYEAESLKNFDNTKDDILKADRIWCSWISIFRG